MEGLLADLSTFATVVMIDLVLAGDNAVVVGMAASGLPPAERQRVIMIGIVLAMVMRLAFALVAVQLLEIIGLLFAGGLLLLWVAWKMWRELHHMNDAVAAELSGEATPDHQVPRKTARAAIWQIAIADVSMSLDNVLAVAGAARDHMGALVFGLVLSIALMGIAANYIARILVRYHWLNYVGLVIITFVALSMMYEGAIQIADAVD
ncbi:MAG: YjbE family putative metal transport protein [Geminicoccaceae bacterium]|nr:YjbE family putative metal transport protein [Geminicoccaceae bacterium]